MVIEQWGFFNVPQLLWHGPTVYNGHLQRPVTLTPVAERLAVELPLPVFTSQVCRDRGLYPISRMRGELYATAAIIKDMQIVRGQMVFDDFYIVVFTW